MDPQPAGSLDLSIVFWSIQYEVRLLVYPTRTATPNLNQNSHQFPEMCLSLLQQLVPMFNLTNRRTTIISSVGSSCQELLFQSEVLVFKKKTNHLWLFLTFSTVLLSWISADTFPILLHFATGPPTG